MCDDIIDAEVKLNNKAKSNGKETKTASTNLNVYILLAFLLITLVLLIAVNICCYLIKYWGKEKHYHFTSQILN